VTCPKGGHVRRPESSYHGPGSSHAERPHATEALLGESTASSLPRTGIVRWQSRPLFCLQQAAECHWTESQAEQDS